MLKLIFKQIFTLSILLAPLFVAYSQEEIDDEAQLHVQENKLFYGDKQVRLRGIAVGDIVLARKGRPLSDYTTLANDWHANIVRLSVHPSLWKRRPKAWVLRILEKNVDAALKAGMFVIIDYHVIGWPDGYYPQQYSDTELYNPDFELAKSFWLSVARRFGGNGKILFELWNEPLFSKDDEVPEVGQLWEQFKPYMEELIHIVRPHADNVILVSSNGWAYFLDGVKNNLIDDENTAYTWHVYSGHSFNDQRAWASHLDSLQHFKPVLVTEWGFERYTSGHWRGTAATFGNKFVRNFLERKGLHNTAWCWHPEWGPAMLKKDWKTPNEFGAFVKAYLRSRQSSPKI